MELPGICINYNDMWRKKDAQEAAENYTEVYFRESDVIELKQRGATHIDFHAIWWKRLVDPITGEMNMTLFEEWIDPFIGYCEKHGLPYTIFIAPLRVSNLQWGTYHMPQFVWEAGGFTSGWWDLPDAMRIQAEIIFRFFADPAPEWEECRQRWYNLMTFIADRYKSKNFMALGPTVEPIHHTSEYQTTEISQTLGIAYSRTMEECIDAIRSVNPTLTVIVERPYLLTYDHIQPVNRSNIVWSAHAYYSKWNPTMQGWKDRIYSYVQKFVTEFKKPLYIGEYGIDPIDFFNGLPKDVVNASITEMVEYMDSLPILGSAFFAWGRLYGRGWSNWRLGWYNQEETQHVLETVIKPTPVSPFNLGTALTLGGLTWVATGNPALAAGAAIIGGLLNKKT